MEPQPSTPNRESITEDILRLKDVSKEVQDRAIYFLQDLPDDMLLPEVDVADQVICLEWASFDLQRPESVADIFRSLTLMIDETPEIEWFLWDGANMIEGKDAFDGQTISEPILQAIRKAS